MINVASIHIHPQYDIFTLDYDIAILRLTSDLSFGPNVQSIGLPPGGLYVPAGTIASIAGWGTLVVSYSTVFYISLEKNK